MRRNTYDNGVPPIVVRGGHPGLPQLWFLADSATATHAAHMMRRNDAGEDGLFDAPSEAPAQDERAKDDGRRDE
jgi:hypothetical protein